MSTMELMYSRTGFSCEVSIVSAQKLLAAKFTSCLITAPSAKADEKIRGLDGVKAMLEPLAH